MKAGGATCTRLARNIFAPCGKVEVGARGPAGHLTLY